MSTISSPALTVAAADTAAGSVALHILCPALSLEGRRRNWSREHEVVPGFVVFRVARSTRMLLWSRRLFHLRSHRGDEQHVTAATHALAAADSSVTLTGSTKAHPCPWFTLAQRSKWLRAREYMTLEAHCCRATAKAPLTRVGPQDKHDNTRPAGVRSAGTIISSAAPGYKRHCSAHQRAVEDPVEGANFRESDGERGYCTSRSEHREFHNLPNSRPCKMEDPLTFSPKGVMASKRARKRSGACSCALVA